MPYSGYVQVHPMCKYWIWLILVYDVLFICKKFYNEAYEKQNPPLRSFVSQLYHAR